MDREQFIVATAVTLFAAFVMGWFASWLIHRLTRATRADMGELDRMAQQLHEAEEAIATLEARESDLSSRLAAAGIELRGAMDALAESRAEVEELRDYIEKKLARSRGAS
ncbi:hypothetical protein GI374_01325 [Paracoccus sp. S-4012]|uniref:hypothetical protein n=1 Tax=Paracoccus sp. S-4012 TaxID=2665648 RepID=UPI0012AF09E7|nr:hypothetical protein [Paracoccus sp. S-4012]MRX49099.1 hypothetical protein [Paracoccus sp. S-4012]